MAASMSLHVPTSEFARSLTDLGSFADAARITLNFDLMNWETALGATVSIKIDVDNRATSGTLSYGNTWAAIWVRNYPQLVAGGGAVNFYSTTSSGFTGLVSRGAVSFATANGALMIVKLGSGGTTNRYWQIDIATGNGIAPEVAWVAVGKKYDITARWNFGAPKIRDDKSFSELSLGRSVSSRLVRRSLNLNIETRQWQDAFDVDAVAMQDAFDFVGGPYLPFVLEDYDVTLMNQHRVVRFDPQTHGNGQGIARVQNQFDRNDFSVTLRDVPRIDYGSNL